MKESSPKAVRNEQRQNGEPALLRVLRNCVLHPNWYVNYFYILIMAYVIAGEIVFDDLPEYPEENTYEANRMAYESDIDDGMTVEDIINLDLPF